MHLYLHVPFCQRRCSYCDFSIAVRKRIPAREYVDAIVSEMTVLGIPEQSDGRGTIYFGGGTPSLLPPEAIRHLLHELLSGFGNPGLLARGKRIRLTSADPGLLARGERTPVGSADPGLLARGSNELEVTLEANPEDVTPDHARDWHAAGINRVSLGAQSFDDAVLKWMHRSHDAAQTKRAVQALRDAGIENISLDLIFGLPEELQRNWERDLDILCSLLPAHCSLYGLTVEPRTPLDRWISRGATHAPNDERYADEYLMAHRRLAAEGFAFYEVSNAAREGYRSRHNSAYWSGTSYVGLGPAAHSFDGKTRRWNLRAWEAYRRAIATGRSPVESEESLTDEQRELERVYLALRTEEGLAITAPYRRLPPLTAQGWVEVRDGRLKCTPEGWLRLDSVVNELAMNTGIQQ
ncbi:MAG TPA: coproporphyrinogen-III oxidase family protein [Gemmatimonadales bacterium]|nr:coproporphyrinogen-III oxidase family protein [Gemmatimonadales bacterium]